MPLFYDPRDREAARMGDRRLKWLYEMGARSVEDAKPGDEGYLFAGIRTVDDYRSLVAGLPLIRDRPDEREPLIELDRILDALDAGQVRVPTPQTWRLTLDAEIPADLRFPLFVRTTRSSWKLGGSISKVRNERELVAEMEALRRAIQWDAVILAREWVNLAPAGAGVYGKYPQEVRVWIVDGHPYAWSFHYLNALATPSGFPPSPADLAVLHKHSIKIGGVFRSRLVVADFARLTKGGWIFIEANPGSAAGTAHEAVFTAVARKLLGESSAAVGDRVGGLFP